MSMAVITGTFTGEEARTLPIVFSAGRGQMLPVKVLEHRLVGPSPNP